MGRVSQENSSHPFSDLVASRIILRCGSVQYGFLVSGRIFSTSHQAGRWRFSGLAFQSSEIAAMGLSPNGTKIAVSPCLQPTYGWC
jgi:hypothetical protein